MNPVTTGPRATPATEPSVTTLLDLSSQAFCLTDGAGTVLWCNESLDRALGYGPGGLVGAHLGNLLHPDDSPVWRRTLDPPGCGADGAPVELRLRTKQRAWRWFEWTTSADRDGDRFYGAGRDVTDRRDDEASLTSGKARLRGILEHSPSAVFVKGLDGRYLVANEQFARVVGVPKDDVVGRTTAECWPTDAAVIAERERALVESGGPCMNDERLHTVDGPRDFVVNRFLLRGDDDAPYALGGIATDVTERLAAERALAARDRLLDSVIKASPDMITLMDRKGKIHQISEAGSAMFGYPYEVFTKSDMFDFVHPDDFDDVASIFIRMVTGAVSHLHLRYRLRHASGTWVTVDSRARAVLDADGHFAGAVVVSRDISDKLEAEERLHASHRAAEHASRAKSEFLSRMSHELRTPLNSILGFAQLLDMDDLPPQQSEAVEHILRSGHHLLNLIDEVLDIARIEAGHLDLTMAAVPVAEIVAEAVELTQPMADRSGIELRVSFDPQHAFTVTADRQRLLQVLLNLLSNAVKYNRPGGWVDVTCRPGPGGRLRVAVSDSGRGIRTEDLGRVFVPFDRLGVEQTGIEGTGVGMALARHLCERMGGSLDVESVLDVGTTFLLDLPSVEAAALGPAPGPAPALVVGPPPPTGAAGTAPSPGTAEGSVLPSPSRSDPGAPSRTTPPPDHAFRVLLIEENLTTLDLVERVLSRRPGTEVLAAMQGGLGADLAREHVPDLVLLDVRLPDMTGSAVFDRLRADPITSGIPVAIVGADAPAHEVRQLLGRGVVSFLAKPLDVRGLLSLVDAVRAAGQR